MQRIVSRFAFNSLVHQTLAVTWKSAQPLLPTHVSRDRRQCHRPLRE